MSQEKVAKYKEEKANRKAIMKKQKRVRILTKCVSVVVLVLVLGWIGKSGVETYLDSRPRTEVEVDYTAVTNYQQGLGAE